MTRSRDDILREIAREEARLAELDQAREETQARVAALRSELETAASVHPTLARGSTPQTAAEKIQLFRSHFRGRPDTFPVRFVSKKTGKPGYSPACLNKWHPGLCALRSGGKCGDCANQAFIPVNDQVVLDHLQGRHVMGVYPLLEDETCWFLAADFDKSHWMDDVAAFRETCTSVGVPVAIERSRSGNGAHAWFFFNAPIAANVARRMGCYLITETMRRRHELGMGSYDRLFPNQDTMPRGGFGNLIALPLQHDARQDGNSVFVDERFEAYADQWAFLAAASRLDADVVKAIAREATRTDQVLGVRSAEMTDAQEIAASWIRAPSSHGPAKQIADPLPPEIKGVLAQRLFVEKTGLSAAVLNDLKRLAAFQNPEFYKKQSMRLSTALTPRVIACAEELPRFVALPRGCAAEASQLLAEYGSKLSIEDQRSDGSPLNVKFAGELTTIQTDAARALLAHDIGVFVGPPGIGKTVLGTYLIAERARNTLILVHRKPLLEQWIAQLAMFLDVDETSIGQVGGGKRRPNGRLDVAMIQSLVRQNRVDEVVSQYGHVIVDECHHLPAVSFERVLSEVPARFMVGLTATPQRRDGHHPITEMQLGPVRHKIDVKSRAARRPFDHRLIVRETSFRMISEARAGIQELYGALARDEARNRRILDDVIALLEEGRSPIVLTERRDHLQFLAEELRNFARHVVVLRGGMTGKERRTSADQLATIPNKEERVILATGRYIGEGFDHPRLDTLLLAMPISWRGTLIQYSGRLHRYFLGKTEVRIYDYVDSGVPVLLRMFEKRLRTYRAIGYARDEAPLGFGEPPEENFVEYDDEALRHFERTV
jgi:superfamily II DNA or RNA helicase